MKPSKVYLKKEIQERNYLGLMQLAGPKQKEDKQVNMFLLISIYDRRAKSQAF